MKNYRSTSKAGLTQKDFDQFVTSTKDKQLVFLFNKVNELILEVDELKAKKCCNKPTASTNRKKK